MKSIFTLFVTVGTFIGPFFLLTMNSVTYAMALIVGAIMLCRGITVLFGDRKGAVTAIYNTLYDGQLTEMGTNVKKVGAFAFFFSGVLAIVLGVIAFTQVSAFIIPSIMVVMYVITFLYHVSLMQSMFNYLAKNEET